MAITMTEGIRRDLFNPGEGTMPPYLAGRENELSQLEYSSLRVREGKATPAVYIYGPRGNGKTVLLQTYIESIRKEDKLAWRKKPNIVKVSAANLDSMATVHRCLKSGKVPKGGRMGFKGGGLGGGYEGAHLEGSVEFHKNAQATDALRHALEKQLKTRSFVLAIDEAHTLDPGVGHSLLNIFQDVRTEGKPALLILAGTPDLERHLGRMGTTFWERGEPVPVGLLNAEAAKSAVVNPLRDVGVEFDPEALEKVVSESQGYPFFLQLWGKALVEVSGRDTKRIGMMEVRGAERKFITRRGIFYGKRYVDLGRDKLFDAAVGVAEHMRGKSSIPTREMAINAVSSKTPSAVDPDEALDGLVGHGYIWLNEEGEYVPGIPNLMNYCMEKNERNMKRAPESNTSATFSP